MKHPKQKGNRFENLIYKELRVLGHAKRTIGSGSSDEPGDITFTPFGSEITYAIECKHRKKIRWSEKVGFWNKLDKHAKKIMASGNIMNKQSFPVVIYRENKDQIQALFMVKHPNMPVLACMTFEDWKRWSIKNG